MNTLLKIKLWLRVAIIISFVWLLYVLADSYFWNINSSRGTLRLSDFIEKGLLPITIFWGLIWIGHGFIQHKKKDK